MTNPIPSQIALTAIANGTLADGSIVQANDAAIQAAVNGLIAALSNGTSGLVLQAVDAADVQWTNTLTPTYLGVTWGAAVNVAANAITVTSSGHGINVGDGTTVNTINGLPAGGFLLLSNTSGAINFGTSGNIAASFTLPNPGVAFIVWDAHLLKWSCLLISTSLGYEIGYDQITAGVNITGLNSGAATTVIPGTSHLYDGTPVIVEFYSPSVVAPSQTTGDQTNLALFDGATLITVLASVKNPSVGFVYGIPVLARTRITPTAGAHTYGIRSWVTDTTGTPNVGAGTGAPASTAPAYVRVTKV